MPLLGLAVASQASAPPCSYSDLVRPDPATAWSISQTGLTQLKQVVRENDSAIHHIATGVAAGSFVYLNGRAGGAKTMLAKLFLEAELRTIGPTEKMIFMRQMHQLLTEGVIIGYPKVKRFLDSGDYEVETATSLVGDRFIYFLVDEIDKAQPNVQASLLSVMAERRVMLGGRVVDAAIFAGLSTSNKTLAEFLAAFEDSALGEALLDRFNIKHHVQNKIVSGEVAAVIIKSKISPEILLQLSALQPLVYQVKIPDPLLKKIADVILDLALLEQRQRVDLPQGGNPLSSEEATPYFAANQFTNRSNKSLVLDTLRARFLVHQLVQGIPFESIRLEMGIEDLIHLQAGAIQGGPGELVLQPPLVAGGPRLVADDGFLARYLAQPHLWPDEKLELNAIAGARARFVSILNRHLPRPLENISLAPKNRPLPALLESLPPPGSVLSESLMYSITQRNLLVLSRYLPGLEYAIGSGASTLLARQNILYFGGPGGAKSYLSELLAQLELQGSRYRDPSSDADRFSLQFNRQTPEGVLSGFPIPDVQLKQGKIQYNYSQSQVHRRFVIGIWDEVAQAHPGTLASGLSLLNPVERSVLHITAEKSELKTVFLTSNKLPHEIVDGFGRNRTTGLAVTDRISQKVYVFNQFSDSFQLAEFLRAQLDNGRLPDTAGGSHLLALASLVDRVVVPDYVREVARKISQQFQGKQIELYQQSFRAHNRDPQIYPYYFLPPGEGSGRSEILNEQTAKATFLLRQMLAGVPYEQLRTQMDLKDLDCFHISQRYGVPGKESWHEDTSLGTLTFTVDEPPPSGDALMGLSRRNREFLNYVAQDTITYHAVANIEVQTLLRRYREIVSQFPNLYPELQWLKQGNSP